MVAGIKVKGLLTSEEGGLQFCTGPSVLARLKRFCNQYARTREADVPAANSGKQRVAQYARARQTLLHRSGAKVEFRYARTREKQGIEKILADVGEDALKFKGVYLDANGTGMYARSACLARSKKTDARCPCHTPKAEPVPKDRG